MCLCALFVGLFCFGVQVLLAYIIVYLDGVLRLMKVRDGSDIAVQ